MALVNQPPILASSFAVNGDKNTIPTTNSGTEGLASLSLGFPPITQQPVSQGGIPPQRADFNGIFNLITNFLMFIQNGSIFAYSSSLDYQPPAIVYGNNALYRCIATNGANTSAGVQPLSNTSYWQPLIPVGGITVSGNTITVTNETGTQIKYTIDTITNPPLQSDSSNKIVTSAWVKAYTPSKTGSGASGTWNITANKAIADKNGLQIDTGYLKLSGGTMTGNITVSNDKAIYFKSGTSTTDNGIGFYASNVTNSVGIVDLSSGKVDAVLTCNTGSIPNFPKGATAQTPSTSDNNTRVATTAFVNNYAPSKTGNGATGTWNININGNAKSDSQGQVINTTYVKEVTANNATLTITKGNGTTSTTTINNVANAIKATQDSNGDIISSTYLKLSGGTMTGNITVSNDKAIYFKSGTSTTDNGIGFYASNVTNSVGIVDLSSGKVDAVLTCNTGSIPNFPKGATAQTPSTSDNNTRVATTAFVKSLFTASKTNNGWWKDGNTGIVRQWGYISQGNYSAVTHNFPISFPNKCFAVIAICAGDIGTGATKNAISTNILSKSQFKLSIGEFSSVYWEAIGY